MLRRFRNTIGERGAAALELSLSMPVLLAATAGVIEFGQAFHLRQTLVNAASEAARVGTQLTCPRPTQWEARAAAEDALQDAGLDPAQARILLTNTGGEPGSDMLVSVAYDTRMPMLRSLLHLTAMDETGRLEIRIDVAAENE